jgi:NDP-sugar pyrophosphorylase family protein
MLLWERAGALGLLNPRPELPFIVTNGDVLTDIRYGELLDFHQRSAAAATMAVRLYEWQHPFGVVHTRGVDIVGLEEKPDSPLARQRRRLRVVPGGARGCCPALRAAICPPCLIV